MRKLTYLTLISEIETAVTDIWYIYTASVFKVPFNSYTHGIQKIGSDEMIVVTNTLSETVVILDLKTLVNVSPIQPVGGNANTVDVSLSALTTNSTVNSMPIQDHNILSTPDQTNVLKMIPGQVLSLENSVSFEPNAELDLTLKPGSVLQSSNQVSFGGSLNTNLGGNLNLGSNNGLPVILAGHIDVDALPRSPLMQDFVQKFINWPSYFPGITSPLGTIQLSLYGGGIQTLTFDHNSPPRPDPVITMDANGIVVFSGFIDNATGYTKYLVCHYTQICAIQYSIK